MAFYFLYFPEVLEDRLCKWKTFLGNPGEIFQARIELFFSIYYNQDVLLIKMRA